MNFPVLSTKRLVLRAMTMEDATAFRALLSIPEVTRYSNWPDAPSEEEGVQIAQEYAGLFSSEKGCSWVIEDLQFGNFIGSIRFNYFNKSSKVGGIGYELHPRYWGCGLMTEAVRTVVAHGHDYFDINRIEAWTLPGNPASDRVLEKSGFRYEGTLRQMRWFKGAFHDFRWFGRIASDPRS